MMRQEVDSSGNSRDRDEIRQISFVNVVMYENDDVNDISSAWYCCG